jgi:hypothetical protein
MSNYYPYRQITTLCAGIGVVLVGGVLLFRRYVLRRHHRTPVQPVEEPVDYDDAIVAPTG